MLYNQSTWTSNFTSPSPAPWVLPTLHTTCTANPEPLPSTTTWPEESANKSNTKCLSPAFLTPRPWKKYDKKTQIKSSAKKNKSLPISETNSAKSTSPKKTSSSKSTPSPEKPTARPSKNSKRTNSSLKTLSKLSPWWNAPSLDSSLTLPSLHRYHFHIT